MDDGESIQDYCSRVVTIVNQIHGLSYKLGEEEVVAKVLRSLAPKFDFVAVAIEESKDITSLSLHELCGSLEAHEVRVNQALLKVGERALPVKSDATTSKGCEDGNSSHGSVGYNNRGRGSQFARWRGRRRGARGRSIENKSNVQCFHCKKFGHVKADCWARNKQSEKLITVIAELGENNNNLFKANNSTGAGLSSVWLIDSGCSNHMTEDKSLFSSLDESQKIGVRLRE